MWCHHKAHSAKTCFHSYALNRRIAFIESNYIWVFSSRSLIEEACACGFTNASKKAQHSEKSAAKFLLRQLQKKSTILEGWMLIKDSIYLFCALLRHYGPPENEGFLFYQIEQQSDQTWNFTQWQSQITEEEMTWNMKGLHWFLVAETFALWREHRAVISWTTVW